MHHELLLKLGPRGFHKLSIHCSVISSSPDYPLEISIQKVMLVLKHPVVLLSSLNHPQSLMCPEKIKNYLATYCNNFGWLWWHEYEQL